MLGITLRAVNSNEDLRLEIYYDKHNNDFSTAILGKYDGKDIQIDFNSLSVEEMQDLVSFLQLRLKQAEKFVQQKPQQVYRSGDAFPPSAIPSAPVPVYQEREAAVCKEEYDERKSQPGIIKP